MEMNSKYFASLSTGSLLPRYNRFLNGENYFPQEYMILLSREADGKSLNWFSVLSKERRTFQL